MPAVAPVMVTTTLMPRALLRLGLTACLSLGSALPAAAQTSGEQTPAVQTLAPTPAERALGEELLSRGKCRMCHRWDRDWIGPSLASIADRYQDTSAGERTELVRSLRRGVTGHRSSISMAPADSSQLTDAELRRVLDHILSTPPELRK